MNKLIFILSIIFLAVLFKISLKPAYITAINKTTEACTIDMAKNKNLICD